MSSHHRPQRRHLARLASSQRRRAGFILLPVALVMSLLGMLAWQINRQAGTDIELGSDTSAADLARYSAEAGLAYASQQLNALNCAATPSSYALSLPTAGTAAVSVTGTALASRTLSSTGSYNGATQTLSRTVTLYGSTQYLLNISRPKPTVQNTVYDTLVAADGPSYNFGSDNQLIVDNSASGTTNSLLRFDLAGSMLSSSAKLVSAQLQLTRAPYGIFNLNQLMSYLSVRKVTRAWNEGQGQGISGADPIVTTSSNQSNAATWQSADTGVAWTAPPSGQTVYGPGDVDLPVDRQPAANILLALGSTPQTIGFNVTPLVADWLADPASNFGLLVEADAAIQKLPFWSSEAATAAYRPILTLSYLLPCGMSAGPVVTTTFASGSITSIQTTTLSYTLSNSSSSAATSLGLVSTLPAGLAVSGTPTSSCGGTVGTSVSGNLTTLTLSGGTLPAATGGVAGTCVVSATVGSSTPGAYTVSSPPGTVTGSAGNNTNSSGDTLTVAQAPPYVALSFPVASNPWGGQQLQTTLLNPTPSVAKLIAPALVSFLPGISVLPGTNSCGGSTVTGIIPGSLPLTWQGSLSGASIAARNGGISGSCSSTTTFISLQPGNYQESFPAGGLVTDQGSNPGAANAWLLAPLMDTAVSGVSGRTTWNWGAADSLPVFENGGPYRSLIDFDLSAIPTGTPISSAKLRLHTSIVAPSGKSVTLSLYAVPRPWAEGGGLGLGSTASGATWTASDVSKNGYWTTAGVVNTGTATLLASGTPVLLGWIEIDVTQAVQGWVNNGSNYGFLVVNSNPVSNQDMVYLDSRETLNAAQLAVSY